MGVWTSAGVTVAPDPKSFQLCRVMGRGTDNIQSLTAQAACRAPCWNHIKSSEAGRHCCAWAWVPPDPDKTLCGPAQATSPA